MLIQYSTANRLIRAYGVLTVALAATAFSAMGCATSSVARAPIHQPGPGGSGIYATLTPAELALGRQSAASPPAASPANPSLADLDSYLLRPEPRAHRAVPSRPVRANVAALEPAPARAALQEESAALHLADSPALNVPVENAQSTDTVSDTTQNARDAQLYASREQQAKEQQKYRGGDVLIISASTILIVLLIVLLIFLLR